MRDHIEIPIKDCEFQVIELDDDTADIEFHISKKSNMNISLSLRRCIEERYKANSILKICRTCERDCKQAGGRTKIKFKCFIRKPENSLALPLKRRPIK